MAAKTAARGGAALLLITLLGAAAEAPARRPGLWVATVTSGPVGVGSKAETCVGEGAEAPAALFALNRKLKGCEPPTVTRDGAGYVLHLACAAAGGALTLDTTAVAAGDFQSRYTVTAHTKLAGTSAPAAAAGGDVAIVAEVAYAGACPADLAPGDTRADGKIRHAAPAG
jgi:hypothetical protein